MPPRATAPNPLPSSSRALAKALHALVVRPPNAPSLLLVMIAHVMFTLFVMTLALVLSVMALLIMNGTVALMAMFMPLTTMTPLFVPVLSMMTEQIPQQIGHSLSLLVNKGFRRSHAIARALSTCDDGFAGLANPSALIIHYNV
ncbi:MAG: hypothetical protein ACYCOU_13155 [Sulfobacillus sp.]